MLCPVSPFPLSQLLSSSGPPSGAKAVLSLQVYGVRSAHVPQHLPSVKSLIFQVSAAFVPTPYAQPPLPWDRLRHRCREGSGSLPPPHLKARTDLRLTETHTHAHSHLHTNPTLTPRSTGAPPKPTHPRGCPLLRVPPVLDTGSWQVQGDHRQTGAWARELLPVQRRGPTPSAPRVADPGLCVKSAFSMSDTPASPFSLTLRTPRRTPHWAGRAWCAASSVGPTPHVLQVLSHFAASALAVTET